MRLHANGDVEIAGRSAHASRVAFAGDAQPGAGLGAGGIRTSTISDFDKRPSPWQVGQTFRKRPLPSQRGQVRLNFIAPAICVTLPVPSHSGQTVEVPPTVPLPLQVSQISWRATLRRTWVPRMDLPEIDVQSVFEVRAFFGAAARLLAALVPKNWLKMSRKRSACRRPAARRRRDCY